MVFAINAPADPDPHSFSAFKALAIQLNGTGTASGSASATVSGGAVSTDASFTTPPAQSWASATATVSDGASTWTTVYSSYAGTPGTRAPPCRRRPILTEIIQSRLSRRRPSTTRSSSALTASRTPRRTSPPPSATPSLCAPSDLKSNASILTQKITASSTPKTTL